MTDTFSSVREALSKPAVVREVVEHYRARLRSPDANTQLRAAKSLLAVANLTQHLAPGFAGERSTC